MIFDDLRNDVCLSNCSCHELRDNHIFDVNLNRVIISYIAWFTVAMAFRITDVIYCSLHIILQISESNQIRKLNFFIRN